MTIPTTNFSSQSSAHCTSTNYSSVDPYINSSGTTILSYPKTEETIYHPLSCSSNNEKGYAWPLQDYHSHHSQQVFSPKEETEMSHRFNYVDTANLEGYKEVYGFPSHTSYTQGHKRKYGPRSPQPCYQYDSQSIPMMPINGQQAERTKSNIQGNENEHDDKHQLCYNFNQHFFSVLPTQSHRTGEREESWDQK